MGFIKAFTGALGGTFADQWQDFYMPRQDVPATAALFQAVPQGQNNGRGENTREMKILSVMVVKLLFQKELH